MKEAVKSLLLLVLPLLLAPPILGQGQWNILGPYEEWITALAVDPADPLVVYAGTHEICDDFMACGRGVLKSTDGGQSWEASGTAGPGRLAGLLILQLTVDPGDPSTLYALATDESSASVWRSQDGSAQWTDLRDALPAPPPGEPRTPVLLTVAEDSTLYVATGEGRLYRSSDGGTSFTSSVIEPAMVPEALITDPDDAPVILVGGRAGLTRSMDGGDTWTLLSEVPVRGLAVDPRQPEIVYAVRRQEGESPRLERSVDGGASWTVLENAPEPSSRGRLAIDPSDGALYIATAADEVWRSTDGGDTFLAPDRSLAGGSMEDLVVAPGRVYAAFRNGVRRSAGDGTWHSESQGFLPGEVRLLAVDPARQTLYAVASEFLVRSLDGGASWSHFDIPVARPFAPSVLDLDLERLPADLAVTPALYATVDTAGVFKSSDGGESWELALDAGFVLALDPRDPATVYAADEEVVFKSVDGGVTWTAFSDGLEGAGFSRGLAIDPSAPGTLYLTALEGLYRSLDGAASWSRIEDPLFQSPAAVVVDPADSRTIHVADFNRVLRSLDGGDTWDRGPVLSPPFDLWVEPGDSMRGLLPSLYAATGRGLYRSVDRGASWLRVIDVGANPNAVDAGPRDVRRVQVDGGTIWAATGEGVQRYELRDKSRLSLRDGRFTVEVEWRDASGDEGPGRVAFLGGSDETGGGGEGVALRSADSTVLQFFSPDNWEMLLKVLDGRAVNDRYWVFLAAATDVGYTVEVTDTSCGTVKSYRNNAGTASPSVTDTTAFADCADPAPVSCVPSERTICLGEGGRFQAEVIWRNALGQRNRARQVTVPQAGFAESDDSGLFYFFSRENWELLVKVLDGCAVNGHFWVFGSATTDVEYTMTVTDEVSGQSAVYTNPLGFAADAINDTGAFATCDME